MKHIVEVGLKQIRCGTPGDAGECPIALRIREMFPGESVCVFGAVVRIGNNAYTLPRECCDFQAKFDVHIPVGPFSFVLDTSRKLEGWKWN